jgi:hypothetical protein
MQAISEGSIAAQAMNQFISAQIYVFHLFVLL